MKTAPDFISTCEYVTFRAQNISDGLRSMADYLDELIASGDPLLEPPGVIEVEYAEDEGNYVISANVRAKAGVPLKQLL